MSMLVRFRSLPRQKSQAGFPEMPTYLKPGDEIEVPRPNLICEFIERSPRNVNTSCFVRSAWTGGLSIDIKCIAAVESVNCFVVNVPTSPEDGGAKFQPWDARRYVLTGSVRKKFQITLCTFNTKIVAARWNIVRAYLMWRLPNWMIILERWIRLPPNASMYIMFRISGGMSRKLNEMDGGALYIGTRTSLLSFCSRPRAFGRRVFLAMATSRSSLRSCLSRVQPWQSKR